MARSRRKSATTEDVVIADYRHQDVTRKNNPPASIAAEGWTPYIPQIPYSYSPRLPPELRFDSTGSADEIPELLARARQGPLTDGEIRMLADALRLHQPWLEWAGKREAKRFMVDPVALHMHERVSTQAILKVATRQDVTRDLFADPQQEYREAVQFYQHDVDWSNRLILGDSLQVMASLSRREDVAGKVQMIYMDPPYGIKFASNFQPEIGKRDVKDKEQDLTREPEMVKAYRDTWTLGIHSYLSYLRDRLIVARELLADTGSIFIQIGDENFHRVRMLLEEVFHPKNCVTVITLEKTSSSTQNFLSSVTDYILWYARDIERLKFYQPYVPKRPGLSGGTGYNRILSADGSTCSVGDNNLRAGDCIYALDNLTSQSVGRDKGEGAACWFPIHIGGREYLPTMQSRWKTNEEGMRRLIAASRVEGSGNRAGYVRFLSDFPVFPISNLWDDVMSSFMADKKYIVQTNPKIIERCLLMTTDPGDLVLDPTCGSGTTAYIAEQWGRRWITIDTSRVAIAIARQRLLTAEFDYYRLRDVDQGIRGSFTYKTVPHITLRSIAQNTHLDPIFAIHEPILGAKLTACNTALEHVDDHLRAKLQSKLLLKQRSEGRKAITEADRRRWALPRKGEQWQHWHVPFDTDPDYPDNLVEAITAYRQTWRGKMDEVNACIAANAEQEELVDQPEIIKGIVRVSGPFTVEAVQPPEISLGAVIPERDASPIGGAPEELDEGFADASDGDTAAKNVEAYLDQMLRLLRMDGVRFPNNKQMRFTRLDLLTGQSQILHAEGRWMPEGEDDPDPEGRADVSVVFGPQYGPVTASQVELAIRAASRGGYDDLVLAAFTFDGPAQAIIEDVLHPRVRVHMAHIRPDVNPSMTGLLKEQPGSQLFTVFGQPRTRLEGPDRNGEYVIIMEGVDIYNPIDNTVTPTGAEKVAAWFIDGDYDGRTFCMTQAFFPDRTAWDKLSRALKGIIDPERFAALSGTVSLPFPAGEHKTVAVKVIDPRGNEVMRLHRMEA
jgi:adenine-specific DNA-methyltransferase